MKIKINKRNIPEHYTIGLLSKWNADRGKTVDLSAGLVRELFKFQETVQDVQKLLHAYFEGKDSPEAHVKKILEKVNVTYNRRPS